MKENYGFEFKKQLFGGYCPKEVIEYIEEIIKDVDDEKLKMKEKESMIADVLIKAQNESAALIRDAEKKAESIIRDAEEQSEKIMHQIQENIDKLEQKYKNTLEIYQKNVDYLEKLLQANVREYEDSCAAIMHNLQSFKQPQVSK